MFSFVIGYWRSSGNSQANKNNAEYKFTISIPDDIGPGNYIRIELPASMEITEAFPLIVGGCVNQGTAEKISSTVAQVGTGFACLLGDDIEFTFKTISNPVTNYLLYIFRMK